MSHQNHSPQTAWWKEAVVYQIYPRSFMDSNGDGIGDLPGIISKLDYIKSLGVDVIWLNPIFESPNHDNGYDVSDYTKIMKVFGSMADFDTLLAEMHHRKLKLVLDLVANHSSSEHQWFKQSSSSRTNPYRDYYHWWPAENGKPAKRFSFFDVDSNAWQYDKQTNAYYLHYFARSQPDLNWENPKVRQEIYEILRFWFDKGVDGFRMDVIPFISKDTRFPELPAAFHGDFVSYYAQGPHLHEYLREMNREVLSKYGVVSIAEGAGVKIEDVLKYVDPERKELNMLYHFDGMDLGYLPGKYKETDPQGVKLTDFKAVYSRWDAVFEEKGWGTIYLGNHDQPRMVSRWGNDTPEFRELSSKMLTTFLLSMRATPFYYFGDELGMTNIKFDNIEDYRDIETLTRYLHLKDTGGDLKAFLENEKKVGRDNGRTPFQWDNTKNAGFTTGTPWLKVNPNYHTIHVAAQENNPDSALNYFRKMVQLRKREKTLVYGKYTLLDADNQEVYVYLRSDEQNKILVLLNFSSHQATANLSFDLSKAEVLIDNYPGWQEMKLFTLRPYEARLIKL
jgi:oligo-1,6-glucosidase